jgi:hypothetical protein
MTGQIFFRDVAQAPASCPPGTKLMMFVGIVAVKESPFKGEHQYVVSGTDDGVVNIHPEGSKDLTQLAAGSSLAGLLREPIWRV